MIHWQAQELCSVFISCLSSVLTVSSSLRTAKVIPACKKHQLNSKCLFEAKIILWFFSLQGLEKLMCFQRVLVPLALAALPPAACARLSRTRLLTWLLPLATLNPRTLWVQKFTAESSLYTQARTYHFLHFCLPLLFPCCGCALCSLAPRSAGWQSSRQADVQMCLVQLNVVHRAQSP